MKKSCILVASFLLVTMILSPFCLDSLTYDNGSDISENSQLLTPVKIADPSAHDPIVILSDADFETQGFPGSGTETDPYVISSLQFEEARSIVIWGIEYTYFEIRNCRITIDEPTYPWNYIGVDINVRTPFLLIGCVFQGASALIQQCVAGEVVGCTFRDTIDYSIDGTFSDGITYRSNSFEYCENGITLARYGENNVVRQNTFYRCLNAARVRYGTFYWNAFNQCENGIETFSGSRANITDNLFLESTMAYRHFDCSADFVGNAITNCERGIEIFDVDNDGGSIINNTIICTTMNAMSIVYSNSLVIYGNNFTQGGIYISPEGRHISNITIENNRVGGKEILFLKNSEDQILTGEWGQLILGYADNVTVVNSTFSSVIAGVQLIFSDNCVVDSCNFTDSDIGVLASFSPECVVSNSTFTSCGVVI